VLRLTTPIRIIAKTIGFLIAKTRGIKVDEEKALALGLQWLNNPLHKLSRLPELTVIGVMAHGTS